MTQKKYTEYDFICSLGGNCTVAHNLKYKNLRHYALPLDWVYMKSDKPLWYLSDGFKNRFNNFLLRENLVRTPGNPNHADCVEYHDTFTDYYLPNHFKCDINENPSEYERVYAIMHRRLNRLYTSIKKSRRSLLILSVNFQTDYSAIYKLRDVLKTLFPKNQIDIIVMQFCADTDSVIQKGGISFRNCVRDYELADFNTTTPEFDFLNTVRYRISFMAKLFSVVRIRHGVAIKILQRMGNVLRIKVSVFGMRLHFVIGKDKKD